MFEVKASTFKNILLTCHRKCKMLSESVPFLITVQQRCLRGEEAEQRAREVGKTSPSTMFSERNGENYWIWAYRKVHLLSSVVSVFIILHLVRIEWREPLIHGIYIGMQALPRGVTESTGPSSCSHHKLAQSAAFLGWLVASPGSLCSGWKYLLRSRLSLWELLEAPRPAVALWCRLGYSLLYPNRALHPRTPAHSFYTLLSLLGDTPIGGYSLLHSLGGQPCLPCPYSNILLLY